MVVCEEVMGGVGVGGGVGGVWVGFFFFNDTATTEIYTLSLHDALPIFSARIYPAFCNCWLMQQIRNGFTYGRY